MASCNYSSYVGGPCGSSVFNPANYSCVLIEECTKDIKNHLKSFTCYDSALKSEKDLLLARAGKFFTFIEDKLIFDLPVMTSRLEVGRKVRQPQVSQVYHLSCFMNIRKYKETSTVCCVFTLL